MKQVTVSNIPDAVYRDMQLATYDNRQLMEELRARGVSPDTYHAFDYARSAMDDEHTKDFGDDDDLEG